VKEVAASLAILSLTLGALPLLRRQSARPAAVILLFAKYLGTALAPHASLAGALGAALGLAYGSAPAIVAGAVGALLAADYVRRVTASHDGFERAFGASWRRLISAEREQRMLRRRWSWRVPSAPQPRWRRNLAFSTISGTDRTLLCDVWEPPEDVEPSGTAIVYLHGSAWYLLDKDVLTRPFFRHLAAQGHVIMDVAYRLCPEVDVVAMVGDAWRAVAWMKANAAEFGVNPQRVVLMGASAGAHIALLAAYGTNHRRFTPDDLLGVDTTVMAVVSYYGVADLRVYDAYMAALLADGLQQRSTAARRHSPGTLRNSITRLLLARALTAEQLPPPPPHSQMMRELVGGQQDEVPEMYDLASPILHVSAASPPTLLFHGVHDSLVPVAPARCLHHALVQAGVPVVYLEFPRTEHGFDLLYPPLLGPAGQAALYDLERFLACLESRARERDGVSESAGSGRASDLRFSVTQEPCCAKPARRVAGACAGRGSLGGVLASVQVALPV
jgi:acetyl esterase/lipase